MSRRDPKGSARRPKASVALVLAVCLVGCDIPTELPNWNTNWTLLGIQDSIITSDLLPSAVSERGSAFILDSIRSSRSVKLGQVCELCTCFEGPIPRIEISPQDWSIPLPSGVSEAALRQGTAKVVLTNEIGFDLLDNGEGERGYLLAQLYDKRTREVVDSIRIAEPFPPGDSIELTFDLGGLLLHRSMVARVSGVTPGTGCESIDLTEDLGIRADVTLSGVEATSVRITLSDAAISIPDETIEIPQLIRDRLRSGEAEVSLEAELVTTVGAAFDLTLSLAAQPQDLFTTNAVLWTPLPVPPGTLEEPTTVRKLYLLDVESLRDAEVLFLRAQNRVDGNRSVDIRGGEGVRYRVLVHAEIPVK